MGGTLLLLTTDVARPEDIWRLARRASDKFGRIDVWIDDAGVGVIGRGATARVGTMCGPAL